MGLQWLIVEKKALLYNSQKRGIFILVKRHFTLCPVDTQRKRQVTITYKNHTTSSLYRHFMP